MMLFYTVNKNKLLIITIVLFFIQICYFEEECYTRTLSDGMNSIRISLGVFLKVHHDYYLIIDFRESLL